MAPRRPGSHHPNSPDSATSGPDTTGNEPQTQPEHLSSRLTCAQCERMVLDALEETLGPEDQVHFDLHRLSCASCTRELTDAQQGAAWMDMLKAAPPEPPAALVGAILAQTSGNPAEALPAMRAESLLHPAAGAIPAGALPPYAAAYPVWARLPVLAQSRFAMTAAMAFFSVALTMNLTGVHLSDIHMSDLRPSAVRRSFWGANARAVRYYDNLRVVYELQSRVREMQRENTDPLPSRSIAPAPADAAPAMQEAPPPAKSKVRRPGRGATGQPSSSSALPAGSSLAPSNHGQPLPVPAGEPPQSRPAPTGIVASLLDPRSSQSPLSPQSHRKGARA